MSKDDMELQKLKSKIWRFSAIAWLLVCIGIVILVFALSKYYYDENMTLSALGDFLAGSMTAAWSLAGLFFIYVAFLGQKQQMIYQQDQLEINNQDLELNRQEIKQTNETLRLQREEMTKQNVTAKHQQFENFFFNLINTHLKIVEDLDSVFEVQDEIHGGTRTNEARGRDVFKDAFTQYIRFIDEGAPKIQAYAMLYDNKRAEFGHYYRFLYRIIDTVDKTVFVKKQDIPDMFSEDELDKAYHRQNFVIRYQYTSTVRSLLSDEELELLFYNMLYFEDLNFKPLIEKYCLLKSIPNQLQKVENPAYEFHPGAIFKEENPNFSIMNLPVVSKIPKKND